MKASGVGPEGGEEALHFFSEPKNVCIAKKLMVEPPSPKGFGVPGS